MGWRKTLTRAATAVAVGVVPVGLSALPASAFELHRKFVVLDHTFIDNAGDPVTCGVQYSSDLFRPDANSVYSADTATQVMVPGTPDGEECAAQVSVDVVYPDPNGVQRRARAFGLDLADLQIDEVGGNYRTTHQVFFTNCSSDCSTTFVTSPK